MTNTQKQPTPIISAINSEGIVSCRRSSTGELAKMYGINRNQMRIQLEAIKDKTGERIGWFYTPKQVSLIVATLGIPSTVLMNLNTLQPPSRTHTRSSFGVMVTCPSCSKRLSVSITLHANEKD